MDEYEHLKIRLEEIQKATSTFSEKLIIGSGGFGKVYEGEASHSKGRSMVAIKRLDRKFGQGEPEFWKEIMMLSRYTHTNLISLLGFCDEDGEKILVYEHASNGSLDRHLSSSFLTWAQSIKICLDAAKGLSYLHDHKGTQQRVLHRDIKSANILLDQNWSAKLSDMGLSKLGPANQLHTGMITNVVGTPGYCDPQYMTTYTLTKESDIYSFGVVLFEVLCGRVCFELNSNRELRVLVSTWKESYKHEKIDKIIFKNLTIPMDKISLKTFVDIAFQCVHESREQRPKISLVVKQLHNALKLQERYVMKRYDDEEIIKVGETQPKHRYLVDLISHGKRFLNLGKPKRITKKSEQPLQLTQPPLELPLPPREQPLADSTSASRAGPSTETERNRLVFLDVETNYNFDLEDLLQGSVTILGEGSVGMSFKVQIDVNTTVVVKRLKDVVVEKKKFESTFEILALMTNEHLFPLRAFYYSDNEKLLVYDYLPAGSLYASLHEKDNKHQTPLDWDHRMRIAWSAAQGVAYLHKVGKLVHGNIKSSNILLQPEDKKCAVVSGYGLNTLFGSTDHQVSGYSAPEDKDQKLTFESDVYSFGILLLELLTGKDPNQDLLGKDLPQFIQDTVREEWTNEVFDVELLRYSNIEEDMVQLLQIAVDCLSKSLYHRPSMNEVERRIEEIIGRL